MRKARASVQSVAAQAASTTFDNGGAAFAAGAVWGISWLVKHRRDPNVTPVVRLELVPSGAGLLAKGRF